METKITKIGVTNNKISARGGLPLFLRYIDRIGLYRLISGRLFSLVTKNKKGLQLNQFLKQMFAFFMDGTNMAISSFDQKKDNEGYAELLENNQDEMASSHQIKRYFAKFFLLKILYTTRYCTSSLYGDYKLQSLILLNWV